MSLHLAVGFNANTTTTTTATTTIATTTNTTTTNTTTTIATTTTNASSLTSYFQTNAQTLVQAALVAAPLIRLGLRCLQLRKKCFIFCFKADNLDAFDQKIFEDYCCKEFRKWLISYLAKKMDIKREALEPVIKEVTRETDLERGCNDILYDVKGTNPAEEMDNEDNEDDID